MLFCSALEQKVLILLKIQKWFLKAVANQIDENEDTKKTNRSQYGANTSVMWCFFAVL